MTETITKPYRITSGEGIANVWWKSGRITLKRPVPRPVTPFRNS